MLLKLSILCSIAACALSDVYDNIYITVANVSYSKRDLQEIHALLSITQNILLKSSEELIDQKLTTALQADISAVDLASYTLLLCLVTNVSEISKDIGKLEDMFKPYAIKYNMRQKNFAIAAQLQFMQMQIESMGKKMTQKHQDTIKEYNKYLAEHQDELITDGVFGYSMHIIDMDNTPENLALISTIEDAFNNKTSTIQELCSKYSTHVSKDSANGLGIYKTQYIPIDVQETIKLKRKERKPFPCMHISKSDKGIRIYFITNKYSNFQVITSKTFVDQLALQPFEEAFHMRNEQVAIDLEQQM